MPTPAPNPAQRDDVSFTSHGVRLDAWRYTAPTEDLTRDGRRPCVVMAHGFGATKDGGLAPFAERFAVAGADVLVFDYRGFGASDDDGLRQMIDHRRHREDYVAAVAYARTLDGVDPERIVLWGSSYSGGHVVAVAAQDPRVVGVISQGAAMDGLGAVLQIREYAGLGQLLRLGAHAVLDVLAGLLRRRPHRVPIVGPPGSLAAISSDDGEAGYQIIMGPGFRNEMAARGIVPIPLNRPVALASRLRMPLFLVVAERDSIAPPSAVRAVAARAKGRVEVRSFDVGHFEIYRGEPFEESVTAQVEFLRSL